MSRFTILRACAIVLLAVAPAPFATAQQPGGVIGRVTEPDGSPVARATVLLEGTSHTSQTNHDGRFRLSDVSPGDYRLVVRRLGFTPATLRVTVPSGAVAGVAVEVSQTTVALEGLTIIGSVEEQAEIRAQLRDIAGSVTLIEPGDLRSTRQANFNDVFRFTPGVYAQPRFGAADESQLSVRGSGVRNNFHLRGINLLVNGMPYRNADGFTDFESLELLTAEHVEVYKGGNSLRFGGATLGGAINLATKTGYTAEPINVFSQAGSYGFLKTQASSGEVVGDFNYYASYAHTQVDGYRAFADQERDRVNVHLGHRLSPAVDARAFYFFAWVREDLPGSLTRAEFEANPRAADPNNVLNRWGRDYTLHHAGVQLRSQLSPTQRIEVAPYGQFRDIVHPIFRVLDQVSGDVGTEIRYENTGSVDGRGNRLAVGVQPAFGWVDNRHFENEGGERGDLAKDQDESAASLSAYIDNTLDVTHRLSVVTGVRFDRALRKVDDAFLGDGDQSDERWMNGLSPKLGVLYDLPTIGGQVYANASRSFEPPLLLELNSLTVPGFVALDPQTAWQFEVGTRGRTFNFQWDVAVYDIELENEIININVQPFPGAPFTVPTYRNVPRSRHFGVEAGLGYRVPLSLATSSMGGDDLRIRIAYTFSRFAYVRDSEFDGNQLPGVPDHVLNAELAYRHPIGLTLRPTVEWVPGTFFADSDNSVVVDGWTVLGARAEWDFVRGGVGAFVEVRNLTDEVYSPAVNVDNAAGRFFQPADGRSLYAGFRWQP